MNRSHLSRTLAWGFAGFFLVLAAQDVDAHGSVVPDEDLCLIQIGYFKAHFKIYLPRTHRHEEFCEDIPAATESLFVMEYVHGGLGEMPIDFRIIRDVTGLKKFAKKEDVALIEDLDDATVFYRPADIAPDVFTVVKYFDEPGWYIGIVTATPEGSGKLYSAVFPFKVGFAGFGYWPLLIGLMILLQLGFWYTSGSFSRFRAWRARRKSAVAEA
ncbi:MAG: hypothetical protein ACE5KS_01130 [Woeseiaceae bacterium]